MGFTDKLKSFAKETIRKNAVIGHICSNDFPVGTEINIQCIDNVYSLLLTLPNKTTCTITHDDIKNADIAAIGVIDIKGGGNTNTTTTLIHGTKYKIELKDGRSAVLTVGLGADQDRIESIIF